MWSWHAHVERGIWDNLNSFLGAVTQNATFNKPLRSIAQHSITVSRKLLVWLRVDGRIFPTGAYSRKSFSYIFSARENWFTQTYLYYFSELTNLVWTVAVSQPHLTIVPKATKPHHCCFFLKDPFRLYSGYFIWSEQFLSCCFTQLPKCLLYDFQEKNASGVRRSTPPEVHQLLSATWNYSASNLFWLTVPVWCTCGELHNSNWSRNCYFKSKHLPSRAFHCYCLQRAELFWFYSQNVVSKKKKNVSLKSALKCRSEFDVSCSLWRKTKKSLCVQSLDVWLGF